MNIEDLPFNKYIQLSDNDLGVGLTVQGHHLNHVGTVHATVVYGIAEACSGKALIDMLGAGRSEIIAVTRSGQIKYKSPATDDLTASVVRFSQESSDVLERLDSRGLARISVSVAVSQVDGMVVAEAEFEWVLKAP